MQLIFFLPSMIRKLQRKREMSQVDYPENNSNSINQENNTSEFLRKMKERGEARVRKLTEEEMMARVGVTPVYC